MPEGDTIFRAARALHRALVGHVVTRFESMLPKLTRVHDDAPVTGRRIERVESRGKHLLIWFSGDLVLRTHMRMNGSWHLYRPGERWRARASDMRILIETDRCVAVGFRVPIAEFETPRTLARTDVLGRLGPDLLSEGFDVNEACARIRVQGARPIGDTLLDQRVLAGVGNVFKSETLFVCRIDPFAGIDTLDEAQIVRVVQTAQRLLHANVRAESGDAIVTHGGVRCTTRHVNASSHLWVYDRARKPCRVCGTPIAVRKHGLDARLTYWCPRCQRHPQMDGDVG